MKRSVVMAVLLGAVCLGLAAQERDSAVYHLVVIGRTKCPGVAVKIDDPLATFAHGRTGYYVVFGKGRVTLPSGAEVIMDMTSNLVSVISRYLDEPSFRRFVTNPTALEEMKSAVQEAANPGAVARPARTAPALSAQRAPDPSAQTAADPSAQTKAALKAQSNDGETVTVTQDAGQDAGGNADNPGTTDLPAQTGADFLYDNPQDAPPVAVVSAPPVADSRDRASADETVTVWLAGEWVPEILDNLVNNEMKLELFEDGTGILLVSSYSTFNCTWTAEDGFQTINVSFWVGEDPVPYRYEISGSTLTLRTDATGEDSRLNGSWSRNFSSTDGTGTITEDEV